ncbi:Transforming growth factor beta regulator 1 [Microtus ochrogaster]|uniref:Transforming growth factor beta regulator 1 n=1 Tax=Microtus ochrogaster TaxID=79684 RepID=A0A8J6L2H1_MICOH|nr:Transforming growth factor beta regulator 1 [Microtus ochrogaster]
MSLLGGLASEPRTPLSNKARMKKLPKKSQNEKYWLKYLRLRKAAKATVFENAAICDEIARLEEKFLKAKEERIYSLGEIITNRPGFHDESAIYPVGYCSTRVFASMKYPDQKCLYTCHIKDGGVQPQFEIVPEDDPQNTIVGSSADACYEKLVRATSVATGKLMPNVLSCGTEFFGFSHPVIHNLIQSCPEAQNCANYQWVKSDACRPRKGQLSQELPENDAAMSLEAFQTQPFDDDHENSILPGSLDLPEFQHEAFVSSYQPEFLTHEPLVDTDL